MKMLLVGLLAACSPEGKGKLDDTQNDDGVSETSDADQDGYPADEDCDDTDPSINPEAEEICDDIDNDCNGLVDDHPSNSPTWFADTDQDGHGNPNDSVVECSPPTGYVASSGDCNDQEPTINPAAEEICDGLDNNCDGTGDTDTVCPCTVESYSEKTYLFCEQSVSWFTANDACQNSTNYHLAVINDENENSWITDTGNAISYEVWWWIGYDNTGASSDQEPDSGWTWSNGLSSSYTNWSSNQPDDYYQNEDCVHIYGSSGMWNDLNCELDNWYGSAIYYVCEASVP